MENIDTWGNLHSAPYNVVDESHGDNFIKISTYKSGDLFCYGFQIKMGTLVRQKAANIGDAVYKTSWTARKEAISEIASLCATNKNSKKYFAEFYKIRYTECDLFGGIL